MRVLHAIQVPAPGETAVRARRHAADLSTRHVCYVVERADGSFVGNVLTHEDELAHARMWEDRSSARDRARIEGPGARVRVVALTPPRARHE